MALISRWQRNHLLVRGIDRIMAGQNDILNLPTNAAALAADSDPKIGSPRLQLMILSGHDSVGQPTGTGTTRTTGTTTWGSAWPWLRSRPDGRKELNQPPSRPATGRCGQMPGTEFRKGSGAPLRAAPFRSGLGFWPRVAHPDCRCSSSVTFTRTGAPRGGR